MGVVAAVFGISGISLCVGIPSIHNVLQHVCCMYYYCDTYFAYPYNIILVHGYIVMCVGVVVLSLICYSVYVCICRGGCSTIEMSTSI